MNLKYFFVEEINWIGSLAIIVITFPIKIIIVCYNYSTYTLTPSYFFQSVQINILTACLAKNQKEIKKEISELKKISRGAS